MDSMDDMGGMDTPGLFTSENEYLAMVFWYIVLATIGCMTAARLYSWLQGKQRRAGSYCRPSGPIQQLFATSTAIFRELSYPQPLWFSGRISKYFTPPSVGRCLLLACYWIVILILLWTDVLLQPDDTMYPYRWEKVGFRAAWISVTQVPLIYLLSCKFNPISLLTGVSYERLNWLHRWTARTVFLTVIVHWSYFFHEWWLADWVKLELEMMPLVNYGFGAWAVMGWMIVSGFGFFRAASYEIFVIQHIFAAATLLWLLCVHVPSYAMYTVWVSVAFLAFDWGVRIILGFARNTHLFGKFWTLPGYSARLEPLSDDVVRLVIDDVDFSWTAGQHVYLSIPSLRPLETHPFTIANNAIAFDGTKRPLTMVIKSHSGFSNSLRKSLHKERRRVFLSWPLGNPPDVTHYDTVVLVACSTGASFIVPMLQNLVRNKGCVRQIHFHWIVRSQEHEAWFADALEEVAEAAAGLSLNITIHVTGPVNVMSKTSSSSSSLQDSKTAIVRTDSASSRGTSLMSSSNGRPSVEALVRPSVESAHGETAVVACGGLAFTAQMRTFVARLSDERAVHKGTGAQGIYLFTETYGW